MPDEKVPNFMKVLWEGLNKDPFQISPEQLRMEAEKLNKGLRKRSIVGFIIVLYVLAFPAFVLMRAPRHPENALTPMQRIGFEVLILFGVYAAVESLRKRPKRITSDMSQTECIRFYRASLESERDSNRGWRLVWPRLGSQLGLLVFIVGAALAHPEDALFTWPIFGASLILAGYGVRRDLRMARMFQGRIDALDESLKKEKERL